ncbi:uncharacterized protein PY17X_1228500 [Plasmodium yoelii]|uniref:Zinc finger protein n=3 Tax=Plasmodium yoelii TaxID=5861 RepID=A0AAE9WVG3_PLAYO|nr:uncharacterized protein PY17X_1228500 [Plasmodium yoelii]EAA17595.1 asparagine-rich protein [Plasmodium yoelii yoelii]WBY59300.1 zinc finger protein [Plasmodium yoelii yoelii]CDU19451.1 conserved Plasmodium protein, unknown function [Plasmodium yoelii]VTZ80086.1 conserved Plasmodium protein, unknown function [Plasmodium yoelii]|eukprot:XP_726030.1 uncharacterized protein PY17X_1228500 [Plasmodium yoelii]
MIKIYPYPFSKYVKSLPDPPPHKSREIRKFECKKYENDYNWLLEAKNNLKKCFHLCNACSKKFNYMRCLVKNSNVHYEYILNGQVLKNTTKYNDEKEHRENICNKNLCDDKNIDIQSHDVKSKILKITNNQLKNSMQSNKTILSEKSIKDNSIIFSNSLNPNENDSLSFNDDVFIFLDSYSNYHKQNKDTCHNTKLQNINCLKYADNMPPQYEIDDMIIHIKRYFKNDISYFACNHLTMDDVCNLKDEDNNYDNISVYIYDNNREHSMNDCMINMSEGSEVYDLSQLDPMNIISGKEEECIPNNFCPIWMKQYGNKSFLDKNDLNEDNKEKKISIENITENDKLYNISNFYNKKNFNNLMSLKGIKHNEDFINNIYETEIVGKKVDNSKNRVTIKTGKEQNDDYEDNSNIRNYEIEVKPFNIDETERILNLKLLEHIIKNKIPKKYKENELDIRMNIPHFHAKENPETLKKNKTITCSNFDALYTKKIYDNIKDNKSEQKEVKDNKTSLNNKIKKTENAKIVNSYNLNDLCEKNYISDVNGDNITKINRYKMKNEKGDKNNFSEDLNDINNCDNANQDDISIISRDNTYNSLIEKYKVDLKKYVNCTYSPSKNNIKETNYDNTKRYSYHLNKNNVPVSTKKENISLINFNKAISKCINKKINLDKLNNNENEFFGKYKLNNNYLEHKESIDKNKTKHNDLHSISKKLKEMGEHERKKYINKNISNSNLIFDKETEGKKEDGKNDPRENTGRKKKHDTELKKKLNTILNICSIPKNINIHNKISTSDVEKINLDSNKIVYINNNYFFNVKKNNYIDKCDTETANNVMNYNIQKIDFQLSKNKNDIYCFKYMSNVLSNNGLSKESILNDEVESNILKGNCDKLNEIRKKYLLKKYLNEALNKNNLHSINGRINNVSNIDRQHLSNNKIGKNIYDKNCIHTEKFNKKENFEGNLYIKHKFNENHKNKKRNIKLEKAPESPQEQEKIPKPLASQLEVNSSSHLKKTPSYPFEEIN